MANHDPIRNFTAADIDRYHKGLLSPGERHAMEKAALDDPFLADALEGFANPAIHAEADMTVLRQNLSERINRKNKNTTGSSVGLRWWRVAAMLVMVAGAALLVYKFGFNSNDQHIAQAPKDSEKAEAINNSSQPSTDANDARSDSGISAPSRTRQDDRQHEAGANISRDTEASVSHPTTDYRAKDLVQPPAPVQKKESAAGTEAALPAGQAPVVNKATRMEGEKERPYARTGDVELKREKPDTMQPGEKDVAMGFSGKDHRVVFKPNTFRGRVLDPYKNPLPFANITNTRDQVGTYADAQGYFNLISSDTVLNVQVRSLGYNNNYIQLLNNPAINTIVMKEDKSLNEVVISTRKPNASTRAANANMKLEGEPEPEDGWENYDSYLANNLNVPDEYKDGRKKEPDQVKVSFEVNELGEPVNIRVEKSLCSRCDQEAIRLVKEGPKWKSRTRKGRTTVTITF